MLSLKDWRRSAVSIAADIEEVGGGSQPVSSQTIRHTLYQMDMLILTTFPKGCTHFFWQGFSF